MRTAVILAALWGASASADPLSAFGPGEQSVYRVSYLGLEAGTAQVTVGAETTQWGRKVLPIVALAKSSSALDFYPIRDKFVTYWDYAQRRTVGSDLFADENRTRRRTRIKLDHDGRQATVVKQKDGDPERTSTHEVESGTFDVASASFALRDQKLEVGKTFEFPVFTGNKSFTLRAQVEKREQLPTAIGVKDTFKVRVQTGFGGKFESKRDLYAWFTADELRIPVRIEAEFVVGTIRADLAEYKSGRRHVMGAASTATGGSGDG